MMKTLKVFTLTSFLSTTAFPQLANAQYCSAYITNQYGQAVCVQVTTPQQQQATPFYAPVPSQAQPEPYNPSFNPGYQQQQAPIYTQPQPTWGSQRPITNGINQLERGANFFFCGDVYGMGCR